MGSDFWPQTKTTLLQRVVNPGDELAMKEFHDLYGPVIIRCCRQLGLREVDIDDISSDVWFLLLRRLATYDRGRGRFRSWLSAVVRNVSKRFWRVRNRRREYSPSDSKIFELIEDREAIRQVYLELEEEARHQQALLREAMDHARGSFERQTWEAFVLTALEGKRGTEVAKQLGITVDAVYQAKCRVKAKLKEEIAEVRSKDSSG
jgi:RNA polymerase sigma-70 factor (ECF subfamily)